MKRCILVVDDDEKARICLSTVLRQYNHEVVTARSGREALECFKDKRYDLLITEMQMSEMTGIELLKTVKTIVPGIIVIIITDYGRMDSYLESMILGAFEYLTKPIKIRELKKTITKAFSHPVFSPSE